MSKALKCDRCGAYYDPNYRCYTPTSENEKASKRVILANLDAKDHMYYDGSSWWDLCPDCAEEFWNWIAYKEDRS